MAADRPYDAVVVGAGPAGCTAAIRLTALGHTVALIERKAFPRPHVGVALTPGIWPQLAALGVAESAAATGALVFPGSDIAWETYEPAFRPTHGPRPGMTVDRGRFDAVLLAAARDRGARVFQPARIARLDWTGDGWSMAIAGEAEAPVPVRARFLVDATGRQGGLLPRRRIRHAVATMACYARWRGRRLPDRPRVVAAGNGWFWGSPLPDGGFIVMAFLDPASARPDRAPLDAAYRRLVDGSGLLANAEWAEVHGPVRAIDATPYSDALAAGPGYVKVGDAGFAIDPLSSSGVQKAIQSALSGSAVVHTILRRPESADIARAFFRENQDTTARRHAGWVARAYAEHRTHAGQPFWSRRAAQAPVAPAPTPPPVPPSWPETGILKRSRDLSLCPTPCIVGEFVELHPALRHPALEGPVAFLGGLPIAPFIDALPTAVAPQELAALAQQHFGTDRGGAVARWLLSHGLLAP